MQHLFAVVTLNAACGFFPSDFTCSSPPQLFKVFSTSHQSSQKLICDTSEWSLEHVCAFLHALTKVLMCVEFVSDIVDV